MLKVFRAGSKLRVCLLQRENSSVLNNMDLTTVGQHAVDKDATPPDKQDAFSTVTRLNQTMKDDAREVRDLSVPASVSSQLSQDLSLKIKKNATENVASAASAPAPEVSKSKSNSVESEAAPLDLCVKKSDTLSQAHTPCRPKGHPPVQMVLPQVQSQRATSVATSGIAHRAVVSTYPVPAEQTKTGHPDYRVSSRSHGELNLSGFEHAPPTAPVVGALATTSEAAGTHPQDVGSVEPMDAVIMAHHQRPRRFHSQDLSGLGLEPEGKRARLLGPADGQVYPPEDIVAVAVERSNILSSSAPLQAEATPSTTLSGAYTYADPEVSVDNLSNVRGTGEGSRQTALESDIHPNKNSNSTHYIQSSAGSSVAAKSKTGLRSDEFVGVPSLYYTNTSPSKTLSDADLDREFQKHLMEFQALEKLAERKAREQMQVAIMRKRKAEMLRAMEAKKARRHRQLKAAEQGSDLHLQASVDGGQFSEDLRVSREPAGGGAVPSNPHNSVAYTGQYAGCSVSVAPNGEYSMSHTRGTANERQLRSNYASSTYQSSISSGVSMSISSASPATDHGKSINSRQVRTFPVRSHPQAFYMGVPRGVRAPQIAGTSSHRQMQFSKRTGTLTAGKDVEAPLNLSAAARKPEEPNLVHNSASATTSIAAQSTAKTSTASTSSSIVPSQNALNRAITIVTTTTTVTTGMITAATPSSPSAPATFSTLATSSHYVTGTPSTTILNPATSAETELSTALPLTTAKALSVFSSTVTATSAEKILPTVYVSHTTSTSTLKQSVNDSSSISTDGTVAPNALGPPTSLDNESATGGPSVGQEKISEAESLTSKTTESDMDKASETRSPASNAIESFASDCSTEKAEIASERGTTISETDEAVANLLSKEQISGKETSQSVSPPVLESNMDTTFILMSRVKQEVCDEENNRNESYMVTNTNDKGLALTICKDEQSDMVEDENQNNTRDGLRIKTTCTVHEEGRPSSGELNESIPLLIEPKCEVMSNDEEEGGMNAMVSTQNVSGSDETSVGYVAIGMSKSLEVNPFSEDTPLVELKQESGSGMPPEKRLIASKCGISTASGGLGGLSPALNVLSESYVEYKTVFSELPPAAGDRRTSRRVKSDTITIRSSLWSDAQTPVSVPPTANSAPPSVLMSGLCKTSEDLSHQKTGSQNQPEAAHQVRPEPLPLHVEPLEILGDRESYRVRSAYHRRDVAILEPPFMKDAISTTAETPEGIPRPAHNQPPFQTAGNLIVRSSVADDGVAASGAGIDVSMVTSSLGVSNSDASIRPRPSSLDSGSKQQMSEVTSLRSNVNPKKNTNGMNPANRSTSLDSSEAASVSRNEISHTGAVKIPIPPSSLIGEREGHTSDVTEFDAPAQPIVPSGSSLHQQLQVINRAHVHASHRQLPYHQSPSQFHARTNSNSDVLHSISAEGNITAQTPVNLASKRSAFKSLKKKQQALDFSPVVDLTRDSGRALALTSDSITYGTEANPSSGYPVRGVLVQVQGSTPYQADGEMLHVSEGSLSYPRSTSMDSTPLSSDALRKLPGNFKRNRARPGGFLTLRHRIQTRDPTVRAAEVPLVSREAELRKQLVASAPSGLPRLAPKLLQQSSVSPKSLRDPHALPTGAEPVSIPPAPEILPGEETQVVGRRNFPTGIAPGEYAMMSRTIVAGNKRIPARPTPVLPSTALLQRPMVPVAVSDEMVDSRATEKYTRETVSEMERGVVPTHIHPAFLPPQQHTASDYTSQGIIADGAPITHNPSFMNGVPGKKAGSLVGEDYSVKRNSSATQHHHMHPSHESIVPAHMFQQQQQQQKQQMCLYQHQQQLHHQQQLQQMQHQQRLKQRQAEHQQSMAANLKAQHHSPVSSHSPYQKLQQQQEQQELRHHYPPDHHLSPYASQSHRQHQLQHLQSQPRPQMQQTLQQHTGSHYHQYQGAHVQDMTRVRSPQQHKNGPLGGTPTHPPTANPRMSSAYAQNVSHPMAPPSLVPSDIARSVGYPGISPNRGTSMAASRAMAHGMVGPTGLSYGATHATGALDMTQQEQRHMKKPSMHQRRTSPQQSSLPPPQQLSQQHHAPHHLQHLHQMQQPQQAHHPPPPPHHHHQHPHHHLSAAAAAAAHPPPQPHHQPSATAPSLQRHHMQYPATVSHSSAYSTGISGYGNSEVDIGVSYGTAGSVSGASSVVARPPGRSQGNNSMCEVCGKVAVFLCSSCRKVWYCNQQCQTKHWATHAPVCKASRPN